MEKAPQGAFHELSMGGCALRVFSVPSCGCLLWSSMRSCLSWCRGVCSYGTEPSCAASSVLGVSLLVPCARDHVMALIATGSIVKPKVLENTLQIVPKDEL